MYDQNSIKINHAENIDSRNLQLNGNETRGSFYKSHQNYFQKLQKQLIHKSTFYANMIGQTLPNKNHKWTGEERSVNFSDQKQQNLSQLNSSLSISKYQNQNQNQEKGQKLLKKYKRKICSNTSLQNLHNKMIDLNDSMRLQNKRQKVKKQMVHQRKNGKVQIKQHLKSNIERIKQILKYSSPHCSNQKVKQQLKDKQNIYPQLEFQRNFIYNYTFQNNYPSFIQDSPQKKTINDFKSRQNQKVKNIQINSNKKQYDKLKCTALIKDIDYLSIKETQLNQMQSQKNTNIINQTKKNNQQNMEETISTKVSLFQNQKQIKNRIPIIDQKQIKHKHTYGINNNYSSLFDKQNSCKYRLSIDDFAILGLLGEGKVGRVYVAKHIETNFLCALKIIQKQILNQPLLLQLIRQIKIQSFLNHPNIVQLYSFFSDEKYIYLMLQLCLSGNLYTCLRRQMKLQLQKVKNVIKQVCNALQYMHENDILHRDLKPQNIVFHQCVIKLCDFGWSIHSHLLRDTFCGTPIYSCPEVIQKKKYDNKIDVWNVGILTYQLLIGRVPFQIRIQEDLLKIVYEDIYFPKSSNISQQGNNFIMRCLNKNRYQRASIAQLIDHPFIACQ